MIPTYCITCTETPERGECAALHFAGVGLQTTFWRGVHGMTWGLRTDKGCKPADPGYRIHPGQIGLILAHWSLWQHVYLSGAPEALILEDDAAFGADFLDRFAEAKKELPENWEFCYVGWGGAVGHSSGRTASWRAVQGCPFGTHAYLVKRAALPVLLDTNREARTHIDIQIFENSLPHLQAYVCTPSLAGQHSQEGRWPCSTH